MKTRSKISDSGKIRVRAYVGACALRGLRGVMKHWQMFSMDTSIPSPKTLSQLPRRARCMGSHSGSLECLTLWWMLGETEQNVNSAFVVGSRSDGNGGFLASDLASHSLR
jgi:hypothetical protein